VSRVKGYDFPKFFFFDRFFFFKTLYPSLLSYLTIKESVLFYFSFPQRKSDGHQMQQSTQLQADILFLFHECNQLTAANARE